MAEQEHSGAEQGPNRKLLDHGVDPNVGKDTQFKPGQSGNPAGRPKGRKSLSKMIQDMLSDEAFIDKLNDKLKDKMKADPEFQGTAMKAIISTAMLEAMDPHRKATDRHMARDWLGKYGYGTKVDVTSDGERIETAPLIISPIRPRTSDDGTPSTEAETS